MKKWKREGLGNWKETGRVAEEEESARDTRIKEKQREFGERTSVSEVPVPGGLRDSPTHSFNPFKPFIKTN